MEVGEQNQPRVLTEGIFPQAIWFRWKVQKKVEDVGINSFKTVSVGK